MITNPEHIGNLNPFRYRGYYYDEETALYYLQSRYYDPILRRFLNADSVDVLTADPTSLSGKNLYAYCENNPIMYWNPILECWSPTFSNMTQAFFSAVDDACTYLWFLRE